MAKAKMVGNGTRWLNGAGAHGQFPKDQLESGDTCGHAVVAAKALQDRSFGHFRVTVSSWARMSAWRRESSL